MLLIFDKGDNSTSSTWKFKKKKKINKVKVKILSSKSLSINADKPQSIVPSIFKLLKIKFEAAYDVGDEKQLIIPSILK